ncbi:MAG: hypothetical protein ACOCXR_01610 [Phototrophicaceae bacterium]
MARWVTLQVDEATLRQAERIANRYGREVEAVLAEWMADYADNLPLEQLSNDEVLGWCNYRINPMYEYELRHLLHRHRECGLTSEESARLDVLLRVYRRGVVRKARALEVASARGLRVTPGA